MVHQTSNNPTYVTFIMESSSDKKSDHDTDPPVQPIIARHQFALVNEAMITSRKLSTKSKANAKGLAQVYMPF